MSTPEWSSAGAAAVVPGYGTQAASPTSSIYGANRSARVITLPAWCFSRPSQGSPARVTASPRQRERNSGARAAFPSRDRPTRTAPEDPVAAHPPPIPPDQRPPHGSDQAEPDVTDAKPNEQADTKPDQRGQSANTKQNTTHQGLQRGR